MLNRQKKRLYEFLLEDEINERKIAEEFKKFHELIGAYTMESREKGEQESSSIILTESMIFLKNLSEKYNVDIHDIQVALRYYNHGVVQSKKWHIEE